MWAQIQYNKIRDGYMILLLQLITNFINEARRKDLSKSFALVNKLLSNLCKQFS